MLFSNNCMLKNMKQIIVIIAGICVLSCVTSFCYAQNKLTRNQILNAVRTHQMNLDSLQTSVGDSVSCDSTTTKITLEIINDSTAHFHSYKFIFSKDDIEVDVYDGSTYLYRSTFEYKNYSYEKLKAKINKRNLKKIDSYDDSIITKENNILRLYKGNKAYMSVESYNGRTNVTTGFHDLVKEIKKLVPDVSSIFSKCEAYEELVNSASSDTTTISLVLSEESIKFKSKGGEFKKIKVISNTDDWEVLECPEWITYSRNMNNEIIFESSKNETKMERKGVVRIGCLGEIKNIDITQN